MSNKASKIVETLTPLYGAAAARDVALAAVEKGAAENDLGAAPAIDSDIVTQVIKSLTEAKVQVPAAAAAGMTSVQVAHSAAAAADDDLEVAVAGLRGTVEGLTQKIDAVVVHLNKSFGALGQIMDMVVRGVNTVDTRVGESTTQVVELKKSLEAKRAPRSLTGAVAEPNLHDQAQAQVDVQSASETQDRIKLQEAIQIELAKSVQLEQAQPGSQKARIKQLGEASLMLTRPIPARAIASAHQIQFTATA